MLRSSNLKRKVRFVLRDLRMRAGCIIRAGRVRQGQRQKVRVDIVGV